MRTGWWFLVLNWARPDLAARTCAALYSLCTLDTLDTPAGRAPNSSANACSTWNLGGTGHISLPGRPLAATGHGWTPSEMGGRAWLLPRKVLLKVGRRLATRAARHSRYFAAPDRVPYRTAIHGYLPGYLHRGTGVSVPPAGTFHLLPTRSRQQGAFVEACEAPSCPFGEASLALRKTTSDDILSSTANNPLPPPIAPRWTSSPPLLATPYITDKNATPLSILAALRGSRALLRRDGPQHPTACPRPRVLPRVPPQG